MHDGRKQKISGSERKDFITRGTEVTMNTKHVTLYGPDECYIHGGFLTHLRATISFSLCNKQDCLGIGVGWREMLTIS